MARRPSPWYRAAMDAWYTTIEGRQVQLAKGRKNKDEAYKAFHELMAKPREKRKRGEISFAALADYYLDYLERDRAASTYGTAKRNLASFVAHAGKVRAAVDLRPFHINEWLNTKQWNATTRHNAINAVKCVMAWGHKEGYIERNPIQGMSRPTPLKRDKILTSEQYRAILAAEEDPNFRDILQALYLTGARPGEIQRLDASMIDFDARVATLHGKTTRITGRMRQIVLPAAMVEICRRRTEMYPSGPIFRTSSGARWTSALISKRLRVHRLRFGYGDEVQAMAFRHLFATDAMEADIPAEIIAKLMGHQNGQMTCGTYSHIHERTDYLGSVVKRLEEKRAGEGATLKPPTEDA